MNNSEDLYRDWDAAYVLGALSVDERKEFENHLTNCTHCLNAVGQLAGIPAILSKIDQQSVDALINESYEVSATSSWDDSAFLVKLAKRAEQEKRKTKIRQAISLVAAAVISISAGIGISAAFHSSTNSGDSTLALSSNIRVTNLVPHIMTAKLRVTSKAWGTKVDWNCTYLAGVSSRYSQKKYDLVATDIGGHRTVLATWVATGSKALGMSTTTSLTISQLKSVEITAASSPQPLVLGLI